MNTASTSERLSSIVEEKPIYLAHHPEAALALVRLQDYSSWSLAESEWLVSLLHTVHLRLDALVQQYGFYKVDFQCGDFMVVANVSGEVDSRASGRLLDFAEEVLSALGEVETPQGRIKTQISLVAGALHSAVLGKTALKYSVHGRPEIVARRLLQSYGREGCIIASKEFVENVDKGMILWKVMTSSECEDGFIYTDGGNPEMSVIDGPPERKVHGHSIIMEMGKASDSLRP